MTTNANLTNATTCPHCFGDHDGCTKDTPCCSASKMARLPAQLAAFALHVLDEMELCSGTADACLRFEHGLYWAAIRAGLAQQSAGRPAVQPHVRLYGERIRKGESAQHHRYE